VSRSASDVLLAMAESTFRTWLVDRHGFVVAISMLSRVGRLLFGDDVLDLHIEESAVDTAESALCGSVAELVKASLHVVQARAGEDYVVLEPDSFIDAWTAATQVQGSDWDL
jgi:hypothetical protein